MTLVQIELLIQQLIFCYCLVDRWRLFGWRGLGLSLNIRKYIIIKYYIAMKFLLLRVKGIKSHNQKIYSLPELVKFFVPSLKNAINKKYIYTATWFEMHYPASYNIIKAAFKNHLRFNSHLHYESVSTIFNNFSLMIVETSGLRAPFDMTDIQGIMPSVILKDFELELSTWPANNSPTEAASK